MRASDPSACGLRPSPLEAMAFSMAFTLLLSQTCTLIMRGSGTLTVPIWLIGIMLP